MLAPLSYLALLGFASCLPAPSSSPLPPSQDLWYTAPAGFETTVPGAVLRVRAAPGNLTAIYGNSSAAYNILYRTTDSRYNASWAVTTLLEPVSSDGSALLSYQVPYDSADLDASPSYALYEPFLGMGPVGYGDVQSALACGWYVNIPDYEGPLASFGLGVQAGHATLDSVSTQMNAAWTRARLR